MKKLIALVLTLCLALTCATALAEGKLTVVQETYTPVEAYQGHFSGYIFAEVTNSGDANVAFVDGTFSIPTVAGKQGQGVYFHTFDPAVLAPGETCYLSYISSVDGAKSAEDIPNHEFKVTGKSTTEAAPARLPASATVAQVERYGIFYQVSALVTNDTDAPARDVCVVYGLYDAEGKLIYSGSKNLNDLGICIPAGQTVGVAMNVDEDFTDLWAAAGVTPTTVQAFAYSK